MFARVLPWYKSHIRGPHLPFEHLEEELKGKSGWPPIGDCKNNEIKIGWCLFICYRDGEAFQIVKLMRRYQGAGETGSMYVSSYKVRWYVHIYIVGCQGASQLGGSLVGIPPGYKANKLLIKRQAFVCQPTQNKQ